MRHPAAVLLAVILGAVVGGARGGGTASPAPDAPRYLALGDSLAAGIQPDRPSDQGYAEAIWHQRAAQIQDLVLVKLGRGGETGASLIHRDRPGPSQLERAEEVIKSRRTALVTLDIGANEVERCHRGNGFDGGCVDRALVSLRQSLPEVIRRLRAAGRGHLPLVGINYYNSFLGSWVHGRAGRLLARRSVSVERRINATLDRVYGRPTFRSRTWRTPLRPTSWTAMSSSSPTVASLSRSHGCAVGRGAARTRTTTTPTRRATA